MMTWLRRYRFLFCVPACVWLFACTEVQPPVFDEPFPLSLPSGEDTLGPRLTKSADGTVVLSWMRRAEQGATLRFSRLDTDNWQAPSDVVTDSEMFVNWADLPSVQELDGERWVTHWLHKSGDAPYAYDILVAFSSDSGRTWSDAIRPHTDATQTEHGFVSIYPLGDAAGMLWLDGRNTIKTTTEDSRDTSMTLRAAAVAPDGSLASEHLVDEMVCDCCQTDVAATSAGPLGIYRDRSPDEIRDIRVTRFADGQWQPGMVIADDGWEIAGCPVNGPAIDADGDIVAVAWFSAANDRPVVRAALSTNGGRTFREPLEIASKGATGHVGVAIVDRSSAVVSWVQKDQRGTNAINIRAITKSGNLGPVETVGRTNLRRIYPQMLRKNDKLLLVWTDERDGRSRLASVKVPILGFYDR